MNGHAVDVGNDERVVASRMTGWAVLLKWSFRGLVLVAIYLFGVHTGTSASYLAVIERLPPWPLVGTIKAALVSVDANAEVNGERTPAYIAGRLKILARNSDTILDQLALFRAEQSALGNLLVSLPSVDFARMALAAEDTIKAFEGRCK